MCVCRESSHFCAPKGQHLLILISERGDLLCVDWCKCPRSVSSVCVCWDHRVTFLTGICDSVQLALTTKGFSWFDCASVSVYFIHFSKEQRSEVDNFKTTANLPRTTRPLKVRLHQIMPIDCSSLSVLVSWNQLPVQVWEADSLHVHDEAQNLH